LSRPFPPVVERRSALPLVSDTPGIFFCSRWNIITSIKNSTAGLTQDVLFLCVCSLNSAWTWTQQHCRGTPIHIASTPVLNFFCTIFFILRIKQHPRYVRRAGVQISISSIPPKGLGTGAVSLRPAGYNWRLVDMDAVD